MKKIFILMIAASVSFPLLSGCKKDSATAKNDITLMKLNGKVKSIRSTDFRAVVNGGSIPMGYRIDTGDSDIFTGFNEKGYKTEEGFFDVNAVLTDRIVFKYNEKDKLVEMATYKSAGSLEKRRTFRYDEKGNLAEKTDFDTAGQACSDRMLYKCDEKGNIIEETIYRPCDKKESYSSFKYDERENIIEYMNYADDGRLIMKTVLTYDNKNNLIEGNNSSDNEIYSNRAVFRYDDKNNCIGFTSYKKDGSLSFNHEYKYEYDSRGNWIKKTTYYNGNATMITVREIKYYD